MGWEEKGRGRKGWDGIGWEGIGKMLQCQGRAGVCRREGWHHAGTMPRLNPAPWGAGGRAVPGGRRAGGAGWASDGRARPPQVLKLLIVAWDRRLIFTIGTSNTTGESDTVVWNEIHHKTEFGSNLTGHGYPDPNYLDNVLAELLAQGVSEATLKD